MFAYLQIVQPEILCICCINCRYIRVEWIAGTSTLLYNLCVAATDRVGTVKDNSCPNTFATFSMVTRIRQRHPKPRLPKGGHTSGQSVSKHLARVTLTTTAQFLVTLNKNFPVLVYCDRRLRCKQVNIIIIYC